MTADAPRSDSASAGPHATIADAASDDTASDDTPSDDTASDDTASDDTKIVLMAPGHAAGDLLEVGQWHIIERSGSGLVVEAHLPEHLKNPAGQLFGGFTPTYVDMVALHTVHGVREARGEERHWLTTINMRCDYFEPIVGPTFTIRGEVENERGLTSLVSTKFFQGDVMAAHAITTIRMVPSAQPAP